jgi:hypothetical protein
MKTVKKKNNLNKLRDFETILASNKYDCVGVSETWLNESVADSEIPSCGYDIYRKDRVN